MMVALSDANDALSHAVLHFHNEMLRRGIKEMSPRQWAEEFRMWFDPYEFEADYKRVMAWLAKDNT